MAREDARLRERRGHERLRSEGGGPDHILVFTDRVIATLVILQFQLPHAAWPSSTTSTARRSHRPSMRSGPCSRPAGSLSRTRPGHGFIPLADVFAYASAHGVEPRIDGTEVVVPDCPWCRTTTDLRSQREGKRCCTRCWHATRLSVCTRCERERPHGGYDGQGRPVCAPCRQRDPLNHEHRDGCGELRLRKARTASGGLCPACRTNPYTLCATCGALAAVLVRLHPSTALPAVYGQGQDAGRVCALRAAPPGQQPQRGGEADLLGV